MTREMEGKSEGRLCCDCGPSQRWRVAGTNGMGDLLLCWNAGVYEHHGRDDHRADGSGRSGIRYTGKRKQQDPGFLLTLVNRRDRRSVVRRSRAAKHRLGAKKKYREIFRLVLWYYWVYRGVSSLRLSFHPSSSSPKHIQSCTCESKNI